MGHGGPLQRNTTTTTSSSSSPSCNALQLPGAVVQLSWLDQVSLQGTCYTQVLAVVHHMQHTNPPSTLASGQQHSTRGQHPMQQPNHDQQQQHDGRYRQAMEQQQEGRLQGGAGGGSGGCVLTLLSGLTLEPLVSIPGVQQLILPQGLLMVPPAPAAATEAVTSAATAAAGAPTAAATSLAAAAVTYPSLPWQPQPKQPRDQPQPTREQQQQQQQHWLLSSTWPGLGETACQVAAVLLLEHQRGAGHENGIGSFIAGGAEGKGAAAAAWGDECNVEVKKVMLPGSVGYPLVVSDTIDQQQHEKQQQQHQQQQRGLQNGDVRGFGARERSDYGCTADLNGDGEVRRVCKRAVVLLAQEPWLEQIGAGGARGQQGVGGVHRPLQQQEPAGYAALCSVLDATRTRWQQGKLGLYTCTVLA